MDTFVIPAEPGFKALEEQRDLGGDPSTSVLTETPVIAWRVMVHEGTDPRDPDNFVTPVTFAEYAGVDAPGVPWLVERPDGKVESPDRVFENRDEAHRALLEGEFGA